MALERNILVVIILIIILNVVSLVSPIYSITTKSRNIWINIVSIIGVVMMATRTISLVLRLNETSNELKEKLHYLTTIQLANEVNNK